MPDSLTQQLMAKLGIRMPKANLSPEEEALYQELRQRELARPPKGIAENIYQGGKDLIGGFFADPTMPKEDFQKISGAGAAGMALGAGLPFGPKGIKGMYSRVEKLAESLPSQINPNKLMSILKNRTPGEELDWRGVPKFIELFSANKPVPKAGLVKHLEENPLDVKVTKLGPVSRISDHVQETPAGSDGLTRYDSLYQMPGASNYREDLIQLEKSTGKINRTKDDKFADGGIDLMTPDEIADAHRSSIATSDSPKDFITHHWDEPNVLVHVRHNERFLPKATIRHIPADPDEVERQARNRMLFNINADIANRGPKGRMLENVQSDWHQRGAHSGYAGSARGVDRVAEREAAQVKFDAIRAARQAKADEISKNPGADPRYVSQLEMEPHLREELNRLQIEYDNALDAVQRLATDPVPDAPFKDNWAELALKQQLLDIAHNRPDLQWLGIAPSSELRARGEVISPEFQDVQLPRTLEKLLKPFGGKVETAHLFDNQPQLVSDLQDTWGEPAQWADINSVLANRSTGQEMRDPVTIASTWPRQVQTNTGLDQVNEQIQPLLELIKQTNPSAIAAQPVKAPIARLTPEILAQLRDKGFPLAAIMAILQAQQQQKEQ